LSTEHSLFFDYTRTHTSALYTLSLHDALPILTAHNVPAHYGIRTDNYKLIYYYGDPLDVKGAIDKKTPPEWELFDNRPFHIQRRSEEHTSELQSRFDLVCRHLLEKKKSDAKID